MKNKLLTLLCVALATISVAQPPVKIGNDNMDLRSGAIHYFAHSRYLDCIMNCQKMVALGYSDGLVTGLMSMAYDSLVNREAATKNRDLTASYGVDSSLLRRLAASNLQSEIYKRSIMSSGASFYNTSKWDSSETYFAEYLKLEPTDTFAIFFLANAQFYQGKYAMAQANYKRLLEIDFNRPDVHNLTGVCFMLQNNYLNARDHFSQAVILDKGLAVAKYNLGRVHYGLHDKTAALQSLNEAYVLNPKDSNCVALISQIYLEQNDNKNAEKFLAKLYALNRNNEKVGWNLVNIALKNADYEHAAAYLQNIIRVNPKNPEGYNKLGDTYMQMNNFEQAFNNYENAITKLGENRNFHYHAGVCAIKIGLYGKAVEHLNKAAELDATYANTFQARGDAYTGMKKKKQAKQDYKQAKALGIELAPEAKAPAQLQARK
jgi:tetratricopeptide (TPR) repeat protein